MGKRFKCFHALSVPSRQGFFSLTGQCQRIRPVSGLRMAEKRFKYCSKTSISRISSHSTATPLLNNPRLKARGFLTRCRLSCNSQGFCGLVCPGVPCTTGTFKTQPLYGYGLHQLDPSVPAKDCFVLPIRWFVLHYRSGVP